MYDKYIDAGKARFEINISALSRKHLVKQYHRLNNQRLIKKEREKERERREKERERERERETEDERRRSSVYSQSHSRFDYDKIGNDEIYAIIKSFDSPLRDVIKCLNDSYSRFHVTPLYKHWHKTFVLDQQKQQNNNNHNNKNYTHSSFNASINLFKTSAPIDENMDIDDQKYNDYNSDNNDDIH